jgi:hypothetical protein
VLPLELTVVKVSMVEVSHSLSGELVSQVLTHEDAENETESDVIVSIEVPWVVVLSVKVEVTPDESVVV